MRKLIKRLLSKFHKVDVPNETLIENLLSFCNSKPFICPHKEEDIHSVILEDKVWDHMTDNDDLDDQSTLIKVTYCNACGTILKKEFYDCPFFKSPYDYISPWHLIKEFYQKCGIKNPREVTMWKNK